MGSAINIVSVNSLTREHIVIDNSTKLYNEHTHHVMNTIRQYKISVPIIIHSLTSYASCSFTYNGNTLQKKYFNTDLPRALPVRKGTLRCMHSHEPGGFLIYCSHVGHSWIDGRKLSQTLKLWPCLYAANRKPWIVSKICTIVSSQEVLPKCVKGIERIFNDEPSLDIHPCVPPPMFSVLVEYFVSHHTRV